MIRDPFPLLASVRLHMASPPALRYLPRAMVYTAAIAAQQPFHWLDLLLSGREVRRHQVPQAPIIIIGHWRSGTTYLQRLLCQCPGMAWLGQYDALFPLGSAVHRRVGAPLLDLVFGITGARHPTHRLPMRSDLPSEEDIALCASAWPHTPMWSHIYSRNARHFLDRHLCCAPGSEDAHAFTAMYAYLVKRLSLMHHGRQLVLKSPANTTKVREILEAFPDARFIYLERDPEEVYHSNMKLLANNRHQWLQRMERDDMHRMFLWTYPRVLDRYKATRDLIPVANRMELRLETLWKDPMAVLRTIHQRFGLPGLERAAPVYERFLQAEHLGRRERYAMPVPPDVSTLFADHPLLMPSVP